MTWKVRCELHFGGCDTWSYEFTYMIICCRIFTKMSRKSVVKFAIFHTICSPRVNMRNFPFVVLKC